MNTENVFDNALQEINKLKEENEKLRRQLKLTQRLLEIEKNKYCIIS